MKIYREYTTDELVMNLPCYIDGVGNVYPILVKDYKRFQKYISYFIFGRRHLQLDEDTFLLQGTILFNASSKMNESKDTSQKKFQEHILSAIYEMEELFSLLTRKRIYSNIDNEGNFEFIDVDTSVELIKPTVSINNKTFDTFRKVIMTMNLMREPKIYERDIDEKWEKKALLAKSGKQIGLGEMLTIIRSHTKESYETISNLNIFQLYSDYYRLQQIVNYESTRLFATVSSECKITDFIDNIVSELYKDPTKDLNVKSDFVKQFE